VLFDECSDYSVAFHNQEGNHRVATGLRRLVDQRVVRQAPKPRRRKAMPHHGYSSARRLAGAAGFTWNILGAQSETSATQVTRLDQP
jgi:hypothetical protein